MDERGFPSAGIFYEGVGGQQFAVAPFGLIVHPLHVADVCIDGLLHLYKTVLQMPYHIDAVA